jgi:glycosyltransferase involved in cell wall biosynthesis
MNQKKDILISIIVPTYNGGKYIKACIDSILENNYQNFEIIVSDDGSEDNTLSIVKKYSDSRISVFSNQSRLGMQKNYEKAILRSKGDWLILIGQDDFIMPFSLSKINKIICNNPNEEIIVSSRGYFNWHDSDYKKRKPKAIVYKNNIYKRKISSKVRLILTLLGLVSYNQGPQLYTGSVIKRTIVNKILQKQKNQLFVYPIPDISSAISILNNSTKYLRVYESLFLIGTSELSTGAKIERLVSSKKEDIMTQFDSKAENVFIPGMGLTTNLQWYIIEAYEMMFKNKYKVLGQSLFRNYSYRLSGILAMDIRKIKDDKFQELKSEVSGKSSMTSYLAILLFTLMFIIILVSKKILKYIYIITLFICKKIVIKYRVNEITIVKSLRSWDEK